MSSRRSSSSGDEPRISRRRFSFLQNPRNASDIPDDQGYDADVEDSVKYPQSRRQYTSPPCSCRRQEESPRLQYPHGQQHRYDRAPFQRADSSGLWSDRCQLVFNFNAPLVQIHFDSLITKVYAHRKAEETACNDSTDSTKKIPRPVLTETEKKDAAYMKECRERKKADQAAESNPDTVENQKYDEEVETAPGLNLSDHDESMSNDAFVSSSDDHLTQSDGADYEKNENEIAVQKRADADNDIGESHGVDKNRPPFLPMKEAFAQLKKALEDDTTQDRVEVFLGEKSPGVRCYIAAGRPLLKDLEEDSFFADETTDVISSERIPPTSSTESEKTAKKNAVTLSANPSDQDESISDDASTVDVDGHSDVRRISNDHDSIQPVVNNFGYGSTVLQLHVTIPEVSVSKISSRVRNGYKSKARLNISRNKQETTSRSHNKY